MSVAFPEADPDPVGGAKGIFLDSAHGLRDDLGVFFFRQDQTFRQEVRWLRVKAGARVFLSRSLESLRILA